MTKSEKLYFQKTVVCKENKGIRNMSKWSILTKITASRKEGVTKHGLTRCHCYYHILWNIIKTL